MQFAIKKTVLGKYAVKFDCPKCKTRLSAALEQAGSKDTCPDCHEVFVVPGRKELDQLNLQKQAQADREATLAVEKEQEREASLALIQAINAGGKTLDCYDGHLPLLYAQFGFTETGRMKFNRDYAPANWNYDKFGEPDVVFMARTIERTENESRTRYTDKENWSAPEKSTNYYEGDQWDEAKQNSIEPAKDSRVRKRADGQGTDGNRAKSMDRPNGANGRSVVGISSRKKSCGANSPGGGGFQPGNKCAGDVALVQRTRNRAARDRVRFRCSAVRLPRSCDLHSMCRRDRSHQWIRGTADSGREADARG